VRGYQISSKINELNNIQSQVLHTDNLEAVIDNNTLSKDVIIIVLREAVGNLRLLSKIKENGNEIVFDPIDSRLHLNLAAGHPERFHDSLMGVVDKIIFPNKYYLQAVGEKPPIKSKVIYHHIDPRLSLENKSKNFNICYIGGFDMQGHLQAVFDSLKEEFSFTGENQNIFKTEHIFHSRSTQRLLGIQPVHAGGKDIVKNYNCHLLTRGPEDSYTGGIAVTSCEGYDVSVQTQNLFKSQVKLSVAVGCDSNIIATKEKALTELLDDSYPYWIDSAPAKNYGKTVKEMIKYANETYGTKEWHSALDMIRSLRDELSIVNIAKQYINFLEE
jgi:hypothetical protein